MILNLFRRAPSNTTIAALYGAIVAQARAPEFYTSYGVPDTAQGRLEMIILHAVLLLSRLEAQDGPARPLGQALFDHFCSDVDGNLREMGVGDLAVPRKMKAIAEAFYGRKRAYDAALALPTNEQLEAALGRNVPATIGSDPRCARWLAAYIRECVRRLAATDDAAWLRGRVDFPDPALFAVQSAMGAA
jgi:cytochrome b pre-mRNA-processing protein 3